MGKREVHGDERVSRSGTYQKEYALPIPRPKAVPRSVRILRRSFPVMACMVATGKAGNNSIFIKDGDDNKGNKRNG